MGGTKRGVGLLTVPGATLWLGGVRGETGQTKVQVLLSRGACSKICMLKLGKKDYRTHDASVNETGRQSPQLGL